MPITKVFAGLQVPNINVDVQSGIIGQLGILCTPYVHLTIWLILACNLLIIKV